ncbi:MAG: hypothetical protein FWH35_00895 [Treponema sp.]|nr:hypothetical protein [Treponema sp.]
MRILHPGANDGFALLRSLLVTFIVIVCFAAVIAAMTGFVKRSGVMVDKAEREIQYRNEQTMRLLP